MTHVASHQPRSELAGIRINPLLPASRQLRSRLRGRLCFCLRCRLRCRLRFWLLCLLKNDCRLTTDKDQPSKSLRLFNSSTTSFFINQICFIGFGCFTFTSHQVFRPIANNCLYLLCPQLVLYWRLYWRPPAPGHWLVRHSRQVPCH